MAEAIPYLRENPETGQRYAWSGYDWVEVPRDFDPRASAFVEGLTRSFGATRLVWGSDYSQTHDRSYGELVELARFASSRLGADDRGRFLGGTALELWPELS